MKETSLAGARPLSQLLRMAVMAGVESAVQIHIDRGDDLNARDASGMTPLMLGAARNRPAICQLLLSAGADHTLLDPSGKTALEIAITAGSDASAAILYAVRAPVVAIQPSEIALDPVPESISEPSTRPNPVAEAAAPVGIAANVTSTEPKASIEPSTLEPTQPLTAVAGEMDDGEFDLSGWDSEEQPIRPVSDTAVMNSASAVQTVITAHEPIDSSVEWDDVDAFLPEAALPLARADDAEGRARLRALLLRAIREGSVPALAVQAQSTNEDLTANPEAEAYLAMVINDLGAELDERFEYTDADETFEVFVDPEETPDEEATLDEALGAIDRAASPRHEPLRIYQREFQRLRLLTAEEEIRLARDMEAGLDVALDALATWPDGIARTLAAGAAAIAGARQLSSIWVGGEPEPEPPSAESSEAGELARQDPEDTSEDDGELTDDALTSDGDATFADALRRLAALVERECEPRATTLEIRQALAGMRLNRRFLLELVDAANGLAPCLGFQQGMADFRKARDWMAASNLKLAFFHAKKYLHSGEPLDDLAQEGNIGLLKAVDRYDWRRGFRFSTYATWWIRQQISHYIADKARTIRVPVHVYEKLQRAERLAQAFELAFGREPTPAELAERMELPPHRLAALLRVANDARSIDELTLDNMIAIDARGAYALPDPADVVDEIQLNRAVDSFISALPAKEEWILRLRFGIGVPEALTLEEIGARFEVTRERIRQIEAKAIKTLKHPSRLEPFARMVLGTRPVESRTTMSKPRCGEYEPADASEPCMQSPNRQEVPGIRGKSIEADDAEELTALDRLLAQAVGLGIPVDDDRQGSGRIWVGLKEDREKTHLNLVRQLLASGFASWPGKGYWR